MTRWRDALFEASDSTMAVLDLEGRIVEVNDAWREFSRHNDGSEGPTGPGTNYLAVCDASARAGEDVAAKMASGLRAVLAKSQKVFSLDYECHSPTQKRWFRAMARYLASVDSVVVEHRMITELAESRRAQREAQARFESLLHDVQIGVLLQDGEGRITAANEVAAELLGLPVESLRGRGCDEWSLLGEDGKPLPPEEHPVKLALESRAACRDRLVGFQRPDRDRPTWCVVHTVPHVDENRHVKEIVCSLTDITARRTMEDELRRREESLRETGRLAGVGGWRLELRTNVLSWTEETRRIHEVPPDYVPNVDEAIEFYAPEARQTIRDAVEEGIASGSPWDLELPFITARGNRLWVRALGRAEMENDRAVRLYGAFQDITDRVEAEVERRKLESHLQHAQKLESLGVLAGGIAHDFNNLLTTILGNSELAAAQLPRGATARANLDAITGTARRASELCNQMLAYSGKGRFVVQPVSLSDLIQEIREMLRVAVSKKAKIEWHLAPGLPAIRADATQLRQVVMNLVLNASESLCDEVVNIALRTGQEEGFVYVEVVDDGAGMDATTRERIFEPFFTTKFQGRGLGMAAVEGIVKGHGGRIEVESEPGKGSRFRVHFPACDDEQAIESSAGRSSSWRGEGRVLLVDDEEQVRLVGAALLQQIGFEVATASDGREALSILARDRDGFEAVVLDLTMPVMDGDVTWRQIRKLTPEMPVVVASGYSEQEFGKRFEADDQIRFVQKPYSLAQLRGAFEALLASGARS